MTVREDLPGDDPLIDVARLTAALAGTDPPTLLDVRWRLVGPPGRQDYAAGHLPGAVFVDLDAELCGPPSPPAPAGSAGAGRHPLPDPAALQASLRRAGVRTGHPVVVYDGGDGAAAARAWWTLRWAGHRRVSVLDGGYPAWVAAGGPVTAEVPGPAPGDVSVTPGGLPVLDAAAAAGLAGGAGVLVDVRTPERYRGEAEPVDPVAGHVPGAVNLPAGTHVDAAGRFRSPADLRAAFAAAGIDGRPVGAYCGSGVTAAQAVLALHLAGREDAALYVGSWSDWITDPDRPVATGGRP